MDDKKRMFAQVSKATINSVNLTLRRSMFSTSAGAHGLLTSDNKASISLFKVTVERKPDLEFLRRRSFSCRAPSQLSVSKTVVAIFKTLRKFFNWWTESFKFKNRNFQIRIEPGPFVCYDLSLTTMLPCSSTTNPQNFKYIL